MIPFSTQLKRKLKDFSKNADHFKFEINNFEEIKKISITLYDFLNRDYIQYILTKYLNGLPKCRVVLFSETKPQIKKNDQKNISEEVYLVFIMMIVENK